MWLKNAWEAWWAIAATIQAEIQNDPYLAEEAKQALYKELEELTDEYTSIEWLVLKKFRFVQRLSGFGQKTKGILSQRLKGTSSFNDFSNHYSKHWSRLWYATPRNYEKAALDFAKNKDWVDFLVWKRWRDGNILKINKKTGMFISVDKHWNIETFHKADNYLNNPEKFLIDNK